ncbi:unnamed protein product, partial [Hapterophycus canaliculatus]
GCAYGDDIAVSPSSLPRELAGVGGPAVLFPLLQRAQTEPALCWTLRLIDRVVRGGGPSSVAYMQVGGGYHILAGLLRSRRPLLGPEAVRACFEMAVDRAAGAEEQEEEESENREGAGGADPGVDGQRQRQQQQRSRATGRRLCPFVLLTDPYALKHLVMNHQIWGLEDRGLMLDMLQLVHSLVSPHN